MDFSRESLLGEEEDFDNLIILRTCSKAMGMAALRLGFAVARPELAKAIRAAKSPYNVNSLSQILGTAVLSRPELLREALGRIMMLPGETNFAALDMEDGREVQQELLKRGVAVRYTGGLLRVTCGAPEENRAFLTKFAEILEETR